MGSIFSGKNQKIFCKDMGKRYWNLDYLITVNVSVQIVKFDLCYIWVQEK